MYLGAEPDEISQLVADLEGPVEGLQLDPLCTAWLKQKHDTNGGVADAQEFVEGDGSVELFNDSRGEGVLHVRGLGLAQMLFAKFGLTDNTEFTVHTNWPRPSKWPPRLIAR